MSRTDPLYFEDLTVGRQAASPPHTLLEAEIDAFAALSGDFSPLHVDTTYAAASIFGRRIAHGLLVQSIATGLALRTGLLGDNVVAFRELQCKFSAPVYVGDTFHVDLEVAETKLLRRLNAGNVLVQFYVRKQDATIVQRGSWRFLVKLRPT